MPKWDRLFDVAAGQSGYFTTNQAAHAGYSTHLLRKHIHAGRVTRAQRGIYRLVHFPASCAASELTLDTQGLSPGEYQVEVRYSLGGDQAFACTFQVPDADSAANADAAAASSISTCTQTVDEPRAVELYGSAEPNPTISIYDSPNQVRLAVRNADGTVLDDTITLEHVASYPNGPDCGSPCRTATMTIALGD
jgi:hypothetical protein